MKGRKTKLFKFVYFSLSAKGFILIHFHASVNIVPLTFGNFGLFPKEKGYLMTLVIRRFSLHSVRTVHCTDTCSSHGSQQEEEKYFTIKGKATSGQIDFVFL